MNRVIPHRFAPDAKAPPGLREIDPGLLREWPLPPVPCVPGRRAGRTLMIAGSALRPGAAILAATAALRVGSGPLSVATARSVATAIALAVPEGRILGLRETPRGGLARLPPGAASWDFDTVLVGPGMPGDDATARLVQGARARHPRVPLVLAGGAVLALENEPVPWDRFAAGPVLVVCDSTELASLAGIREAEVDAAGVRAALKAARHWRVVILHRGMAAHVAMPDGRTWIHPAAGPALALPGAGHVLAGIATGLLARGCALEHAAVWASALHAGAFEALSARIGPVGGLAREVLDHLPFALRDATRDTRPHRADAP